VRIHESIAAARAEGFRACKRCKPDALPADNRNAAIIARACELIKASNEPVALESLAAAVGLSQSHFHRLFKKDTGVTPKAYAQAHRARAVRKTMGQSSSVTEAIYGAGFNSSSSFYGKSAEMLGMKPTAFRAGGKHERIHFAVGQCSLGAILVASSTHGVVAILIDKDPDALVRTLQDQFPNADLIGADTDYESVVARVVGMVEKPGLGIDLPLDIRGTAFQRRVWQALRTIPAGETVSYAEIARRLGTPQSVRAVAGAIAANNLAVAIPCHRVIKSDGALSGYRWGVARKRALLNREGAAQ
jgi:AraC family transcriptional regulator of adaptative response/methylated-DNA-[protein]-cysteine methyltransferase